MEELDEGLCQYCRADPGVRCGGGGEPVWCEGAYCDEAYERYLDDNGITENMVIIKHKTKVTISGGLDGKKRKS